jgi:hypothetical protein
MSVQSATNVKHAIPWQNLQSLLGTGSATQQAKGSKQGSTAFDPFAGLGDTQASGGSGAPTPPFNIGTMSALIGAQEQSGTSGLSQHQQKVFGKLDSDGDGKVTGAELKGAFGSENQKIADFVMGKLDKDGDGAISKDEFAAGTTRGGRRHHAGPPPGQALDALMSAANGAKVQTTTGTDGASTTTITYADGSKVSTTSAATAANSDNSANTNAFSKSKANLLEQLIRLQAQLTQSASASTSVATV